MTVPRFVIVVTLLAVIPAAPGFSQAPVANAFTHQGYLDDQGASANGSFDLRFVLYNASVDGNQVGPTNTRGDVTVSDGHFTVTLDFGAAFAGDRRWLETRVRPGDSTGAYTVLTPRQELAAPIALWSSRSPWGGISGMPAGFADGVDDDTTYTAGDGLSMEDNEIRVAPGGITTTMIQDGQVDVTDLWLPGVDNRYVNETQLRAGVDGTPTMCNTLPEAVAFSVPGFSSAPAVVISPHGIQGSVGAPNTYCVLDGVTSQGFRYCCIGTIPDYVRWIAVAPN